MEELTHGQTGILVDDDEDGACELFDSENDLVSFAENDLSIFYRDECRNAYRWKEVRFQYALAGTRVEVLEAIGGFCYKIRAMETGTEGYVFKNNVAALH